MRGRPLEKSPLNPTQLLMYGRDATLLGTRRLVLETAGFAVHATTDLHEIQAQLRSSSAYGLLIVCHTASATDRRALAALAEEIRVPAYQIETLITPEALIAHAAMARP